MTVTPTLVCPLCNIQSLTLQRQKVCRRCFLAIPTESLRCQENRSYKPLLTWHFLISLPSTIKRIWKAVLWTILDVLQGSTVTIVFHCKYFQMNVSHFNSWMLRILFYGYVFIPRRIRWANEMNNFIQHIHESQRQYPNRHQKERTLDKRVASLLD